MLSYHDYQGTQVRTDFDARIDLKDIVMGLQWDPREGGVSVVPDDLDALCVLFDERRSVLEIIHPGHPRNANGSVVHTGDSQTGAGRWDDERIFVFLGALPEAVCAVAFIVASISGRTIGNIRGVSCHVSHSVTEREIVRLDLSALDGQTVCCAAVFDRNPESWQISTDMQMVEGELSAKLLPVIGRLSG